MHLQKLKYLEANSLASKDFNIIHKGNGLGIMTMEHSGLDKLMNHFYCIYENGR